MKDSWRVLNRCCPPRNDGLSWVLREMGGYQDLDSDHVLMLLADIFAQTPLTNVITENRFARHRQHACQSGGHGQLPSTHATNHTLSEFRSMWENAKAVHRHRTGIRHELVREVQARKLPPYHRFTQEATRGKKVRTSMRFH